MRRIGIPLIFCIVFLIAFLLFHIKFDSINGRELIWKITVQNLPQHLWGIGWGNFSLFYPTWQSDYFKNFSIAPTKYFLNADDTFIAFNEYLQFIVEAGIIGVVLGLIIFYRIFLKKPDTQYTNQGLAKETLGLILVSAFFSYPLHCNVILFITIFSIAAFTNNNSEDQISTTPFSFLLKSSSLGIFQLFLVFSTIKVFYQWQYIKQWDYLLNKYYLLSSSEIKERYAKLYPLLTKNGKFLLDYGESMGEIKDNHALKLMKESKQYYVSYRTLISTAKVAQQIDSIKCAEKNLLEASNLIPSKFYPKYELMKLYDKIGDTTNERIIGKTILSMPIKKISPEIFEIKQSVIEMLK